MARFTLTTADHGLGFELFPQSRRLARKYQNNTGQESILFQSDWDFPGLAVSLGWSLKAVQRNRRKPCDHDSTDGTVTCTCGLGASDFISAAYDWLHAHDGHTFNDPHGVISEYFGDVI